MKEELTTLINNVIKFFIGEKYIKDEGQRWANDISDQIIRQISEKKIENYKFIFPVLFFKKEITLLIFLPPILGVLKMIKI